MTMSEAETVRAAIRRALKSLRRRHLVEEGAHSPAIEALTRPFAAHALQWKEKDEKHELELQQCYKAQSRLSGQLVIEIEEGKASKALLKEKEALITTLQDELKQTSEENVQLKKSLDEKTKALDLLIQEHQTVKAELEQALTLTKLKAAEDENKNLIDRWVLEKMKDAERLNEISGDIPDASPDRHSIRSPTPSYVDPSIPVPVRIVDPSKDLNSYGVGSVDWKERVESWRVKQEKILIQMTNKYPAEGKGDIEGTGSNGEDMQIL